MAAAKTIVLLYYVMLVLSVTVQAQSRDLQATSSVGNYQLAYDRSVVGGDSLGNLPLDDPRLQRTVQGLAPEQVHHLAAVQCLLLAVVDLFCTDANPMALLFVTPCWRNPSS